MSLDFGMPVRKAFTFPSDLEGGDRSKFGDVGGAWMLARPHFWDQREKQWMFLGWEEK